MAKINEATDTDLKVIEELRQLSWKPGDTLLYQQETTLTSINHSCQPMFRFKG